MKNNQEQALDVVRYSKSIGVALNNTISPNFNGRIMELQQGQHVNFALCDYLGLATDIRIRTAAANAAMDYGVYTAISRTYLKLGIYKDAEDIVSTIFNQPCLVTPRTTLGHLAALPVMISREDAVILDHQVHASVSLAAQVVLSFGCKMEILRHNRIDMLEERIKVLSTSHRKVWYLADGIYSMYGDIIPVKEIMELLDRYPNFHLYIDDAHGMSWTGKNGIGYFLSNTKFHPRLLLSTSLGKGFGAGGGVIVCPDEETRERIEILGIPLMFTSPVSPPTLGSIIESAKIHLSDEITILQNALKLRLNQLVFKAYELGLPIIGNHMTPITFIASGKPDMTSDIARKMLNHGFYITGGVFPAVPVNNSGIRIVTSLHQNDDDIDNMLIALKYEYDQALKERNIEMDDILKHYKHVEFFKGEVCHV